MSFLQSSSVNSLEDLTITNFVSTCLSEAQIRKAFEPYGELLECDGAVGGPADGWVMVSVHDQNVATTLIQGLKKEKHTIGKISYEFFFVRILYIVHKFKLKIALIKVRVLSCLVLQMGLRTELVQLILSTQTFVSGVVGATTLSQIVDLKINSVLSVKK